VRDFPSGRHRCLWRWTRFTVATVFLIIVCGAGLIAADFHDLFAGPKGTSTKVLFAEWPIIQMPPVQPAAAIQLGESEEVIGVEEHGQARAYTVRALYRPSQHVVNDQLGGISVSVTYCDRTNCAAVFTDSEANGPMDIGVAGYDGRPDGGLLLRVGNDLYNQKTGKPLHKSWSFRSPHPFPFAARHFVRMSWKQWREKHPDTDVYDGQRRAELPAATP